MLCYEASAVLPWARVRDFQLVSLRLVASQLLGILARQGMARQMRRSRSHYVGSQVSALAGSIAAEASRRIRALSSLRTPGSYIGSSIASHSVA